jgi:hypothetical protein
MLLNVLYCVWPLLDAKCNLLHYRRHHSICYTCLFTTPLVVITVSGYNVFWLSDVVSRSGSWISSLFCLLSVSPECWQLTNSWKSKSHCDWRSVSKSWCRAPSGAHDEVFITFSQLRSCFCGAPSLTRGRICLLYILLALASAILLGSDSLGTRDHILLSQIWDFPFRRLLRLAGSRWRYSTSPPHGN